MLINELGAPNDEVDSVDDFSCSVRPLQLVILASVNLGRNSIF